MKRINLLKKEKGQFFPIVHCSSIKFPAAGLLWPGHFSEVQSSPYFPSHIPDVKGYTGKRVPLGPSLKGGPGQSWLHSQLLSPPSALPATHVPAPHHEGGPRDQAMASALFSADSQVSCGPLCPPESLTSASSWSSFSGLHQDTGS